MLTQNKKKMYNIARKAIDEDGFYEGLIESLWLVERDKKIIKVDHFRCD